MKKIVIVFLISLYVSSGYANDEKMDLTLHKVSLNYFIQVLGNILHRNIIINSPLNRSISLELHQVSPLKIWDLILDQNNLEALPIEDTFFILSKQDKIKKQLLDYQFKKALHNAEPLVCEIIKLKYAKAEMVAKLLAAPSKSFFSSRGHVEVDERTNSLAIEDVASYLQKIHKLVSQVDVSVKQISVEAKLVNVDHYFEDELGIQFANIDANNAQSDAAHQFGLVLARLTHNSWLDVRLAALEKNGHGQIISKPQLYTANGQTASIEAGEEIPYQETSRNGGTTVSFKKAALSLKVTPQIMPNEQVMLQLEISQNRPNAHMILGMPSISMRQISTNVLVKNGQTIVLGGVYETDEEQLHEQIPFLDKIPLIGNVFGVKSSLRSKRELIIFITPKIIL